MAGERGVLAVQRQQPDGVFNDVVIHLDTPVGEEHLQPVSLAADVGQPPAQARPRTIGPCVTNTYSNECRGWSSPLGAVSSSPLSPTPTTNRSPNSIKIITMDPIVSMLIALSFRSSGRKVEEPACDTQRDGGPAVTRRVDQHADNRCRAETGTDSLSNGSQNAHIKAVANPFPQLIHVCLLILQRMRAHTRWGVTAPRRVHAHDEALTTWHHFPNCYVAGPTSGCDATE